MDEPLLKNDGMMLKNIIILVLGVALLASTYWNYTISAREIGVVDWVLGAQTPNEFGYSKLLKLLDGNEVPASDSMLKALEEFEIFFHAELRGKLHSIDDTFLIAQLSSPSLAKQERSYAVVIKRENDRWVPYSAYWLGIE